MTRDNNNWRPTEDFFRRFYDLKRRHMEKHLLEKELQREMMREHRRNHAEIHRLQHEFNKKINVMNRKNKEFEWYHRHNKYSRIFIILFNFIIWFLIFRYFGFKAVAVGFAVIIGIGGTIQIMFNVRIEKRIFNPISKLRAGVEEISKGNYDIHVKCDVTNEISTLIDSFNEMAKKLYEGEKLKAVYEENRKTLIANISHDLKTPITSIQGYIETILDRKDDIPQETINKYHQIILNNAAYMNKLIDDLFLFSKLDMEKLDFQLEKLSIKAFMSDLMEEFKIELEERQIQFYYKDDISSECYVNIDRKRIYQVFRNIIGNALKYGHEDNIIINVELHTKDDFIYIDIADNGPGIPADKLPHIFDRFYRVDYARTKDLMSTGLGLAIAKELVEAHKGKIKAESTLDQGTCFTIMLPIEND